MDCPNEREVLSNSNLEVISSSKNITSRCNNEHWRAPSGKTGDDAAIIVDLKCPVRLETFSIMNGFGDFGVHHFSLLGSKSVEGPWTELYNGELPHGIEMTEEVIITTQCVNKAFLLSRILSAARVLKLGILQQSQQEPPQ